jgi:hypothetical protein
VIDVGKTGTPHIHYLVNQSAVARIRKVVKKRWPNTAFFQGEADEVRGLLGYFFQKNFLPATLSISRPPRMRLLSGSRGIRYGFPSLAEIERLKASGEIPNGY